MEEVEALDAQAEGHDEGDGGVRVAWIKTKCTGVAGKRKATEVYEGRSELRDPPAKGSYYNKFVGGLRSGNNSELRATLRMCLSLLLFKWKWKVTSCNGCDLYLRSSAPLSLFCPNPSWYLLRIYAFRLPRVSPSVFFYFFFPPEVTNRGENAWVRLDEWWEPGSFVNVYFERTWNRLFHLNTHRTFASTFYYGT